MRSHDHGAAGRHGIAISTVWMRARQQRRAPIAARAALTCELIRGGEVLGIDVGGSSVKRSGRPHGRPPRGRADFRTTPAGDPLALVSVLRAGGRLPGAARVGVAFPSVIKEGSAYTAQHRQRLVAQRRGARLTALAAGTVLNDADAPASRDAFGSGRGCTAR